MRLYYPSSIARIFSSLMVIASLSFFGLVVWKAFEIWQSDPAVQEMQQILQQRE